MHGPLYLDTARFGRMAKRTRHANRDYARLIGDEGASPLVDRILEQGLDSVPDRARRLYRGLESWRGVEGLKAALRDAAGVPSSTEVLLFQRSALLMKLAARALFRRCRRVLHTDLEWPGYLAIIEGERARARAELLPALVRDSLLREAVPGDELVRRVANRYREGGCDGLFLSAVSYEGVRFPVRELTEILSLSVPPRFVVLDCAQSFGHTPPDLPQCDIMVGGAHKWLGSGHPLGVGLIPRASSRTIVMNLLAEMVDSDALDDPLLGFTQQLESGKLESSSETVGLAPLFSCAAALSESSGNGYALAETCETRVRNGDILSDISLGSGWRPIRPATLLRSGIVLLEPAHATSRTRPAGLVRDGFQAEGVALTAYPGGTIRVSLPPEPWRTRDLKRLQSAFHRLS